MVLAILGKKGQVSIEFILIVTMALIYINTSVWPTIEASSQSAIEVKAIADTKIAATKLSDAINEAIISSGDMKKTIGVYIPEGAALYCEQSGSTIDYSVEIETLKGVSGGGFNPDPARCIEKYDLTPPPDQILIGWTCNSSVAVLNPGVPHSCTQALLKGTLEGPIYREMVVEKAVDISDGITKITFKFKD